MAKFTATWIDRLDQHGFTDITVIITNTDGPIPEQRISKNYNMNPDFIDSAFLQEETSKEIARIIDEWNQLNDPNNP